MDASERAHILRSVLSRSIMPLRSEDTAQRPLLYLPGLPARAFYGADEFPWTQELRSALPVIQQELDACMTRREGFVPIFPGYSDAGKWAGLWFLLYGDWYRNNCAAFPQTVKAIRKIPRLAGWAAYSAMIPGSHVTPHCGTTNTKLRLHFAVRADAGSEMRVKDRRYSWSEGEIVVFDDSYEHEVWVRGHRPRIVLICDFYRPELSDEEVTLLEQMESGPTPFLDGDSMKTRYAKLIKSFRDQDANADWVYS